MSVNRNARYNKPGATFATWLEAKLDKDSMFSAELAQSVQDCYDTMLTNGVLLEPVIYGWDQTLETLTVVKVVSSNEAYNAAITFDVAAVTAASEAAGWTLLNPA
jgi:hypothetical protein